MKLRPEGKKQEPIEDMIRRVMRGGVKEFYKNLYDRWMDELCNDGGSRTVTYPRTDGKSLKIKFSPVEKEAYDWNVCTDPTSEVIEKRIEWKFGDHEIGFPSDPDDYDLESERVGPWHWLTMEYKDKEKGIYLHNAIDFPAKKLTSTMKLKGKTLLRTWLRERLYKLNQENE